MNPRSYRAFIADIRRYRPALTIALAAIVVIPDGISLVHQDMTAIEVLSHFAQALVVIGALVWSTTGVLLHYARTQAESKTRVGRDDDMTP